MRIVELRASNFKKLSAIEIRPDGSVVTIAGANGSGKTSTLDAIYVGLAGKRAAPRKAIRAGCEEARISLDLGDFVVQRRFRKTDKGEETTDVTVTAADGSKLQRPQDVLNAIIGELSFDPVDFMRRDPKQQFDALRAMVPGFDFAAFDRNQKQDFALRTEWNRKAKHHTEAAAAIKLPPGPCPDLIDVSEATRELRAANEHNRALEREQTRRSEESGALLALEGRIAEARAKLAAMEADLVERRIDLDLADPLGEPVDAAAIEARIASASDTNMARGDHQRRQVEEHAAEAARQEAQALTDAMAAREAARRKAIEAVALPVPGLSLGDGELLLNDLPLEQASAAEQLRVSIGVAAAMNPKLRVICVRDASLIDAAGMTALAAFAEAQDVQLWIERVDTSGVGGFVIENGALK